MKRLISFVSLVCVTLALAWPAKAQQKITGHVYDAQNNQPIEGANITYGKNKGTITNADGAFRIPCGESVEIRISYVGYRTASKTITNCNAPLDITLQPHAYSLQKITVENQLYIQQATSVSTLSSADLDNHSELRLKSALNTVPGVEMQTRSPWGGQRITIRGYYPNAGNSTNFNGLGYQLYLNNIPVTDATGTTIMDDVDFASLGNVEVIKGPSPLYGNEIAGTVKLHTQQPQQNGTTLSEQAIVGSYGLFRNNTTLMTKTGDLGLRINYGHQTYDSFRPHDASRKEYVSVNGHYKISEKQRLSVYVSYNDSNEQLAGNLNDTEFDARRAIARPNYINNDGKVDINSFRSGITSLHRFNNHLSNKTTVFATGHTLDQNFAHGFNYYNNWNVGARTNFNYHRQFKKVGIDAQLGAFVQRSNESVDGVFIPPFVSPPFSPSTQPQFPTNNQTYALNYNVFTKWKFILPQDFQLSVGGILNFNRFGIRNMLRNGSLYSGSSTKSKSFDPSFSPSVSLLKSFSNKASVYASMSTGSTPPLLSDIIAGDGTVNNRLRPEDALQYEVGSKGDLLNGKLTYKLALFDLVIDDRLATRYENSVAYTTNVGKQQNKGVELSLGYQIIDNPLAAISQLQMKAGYAYSHFTYDNFKMYAQNTAGSDSLTADYSGNSVAGVAPHTLNLGVDLQTKIGIYLHAKYKYKDRAPVTFDNQQYVKSYNLLSGRIGYQKELGGHVKFDAFVGSNNLTGSTYYNFLFVGTNTSSLGDGYIAPAPYKATAYGGLTLSYTF